MLICGFLTIIRANSLCVWKYLRAWLMIKYPPFRPRKIFRRKDKNFWWEGIPDTIVPVPYCTIPLKRKLIFIKSWWPQMNGIWRPCNRSGNFLIAKLWNAGICWMKNLWLFLEKIHCIGLLPMEIKLYVCMGMEGKRRRYIRLPREKWRLWCWMQKKNACLSSLMMVRRVIFIR